MRAFAGVGLAMFVVGALAFLAGNFIMMEKEIDRLERELAVCQVANEILTHALQTDSRINEILESSNER